MKPVKKQTESVYFAEIIESSLSMWTAQCWQWNHSPVFGSIVQTKTLKRTIFGIVYKIETGSIDPIRQPFIYKKTEEELLKEQPQIFEFIRTTFSCLTIGYFEDEKIFYQISRVFLLLPLPAQSCRG